MATDQPGSSIGASAMMRWLLIDKIMECEPGLSAVAVKAISPSEPYFQDHFPNFPIVPGVLQIEMIAQAAGKCIRLARNDVLPILVKVRTAKFIKQVRPGDQCTIRVQISKLAAEYATASGFITVGSTRVSEADIMYAMLPPIAPAPTHYKDHILEDWKQRQGEQR